MYRSAMHWWWMSLVIFVQLLGITTAAPHRGEQIQYSIPRYILDEVTEDTACVTRVCNVTASKIIGAMDITANPCDDFYQFVCGSYLRNDLPPETLAVSVRRMAKTDLKVQLSGILEADYEVGELRSLKLAKTLYKTCMNKWEIERKALESLKNFVEMLGGWPVVKGASWNESNFDWMATSAAWKRAGLPSITFMDIGMGIDSSDPTKRVLYISPPSWIIRSWHLKDGFDGTVTIRAYYTMMVDVAVSLGADREKAEVELKEALLFQIELSNTIDASKSAGVTLTLKKLIEDYPRVDWRDTFARMFWPSQTIRDDDAVIVESPLFINNVIDLISRTPKRVLANFAMFQVIPLIMRTMNKETVEKLDTYELAKNGFVKREAWWISCMDRVMEDMPMVAIHTYSKRFFKPETKVKFEDMIRNIREEFRTNIDKVPFLDVNTGTSAKAKESAIQIVVGYPNELLNNDALEKYYESLYQCDNNLINKLLLWKFDYDREVRDFRKPPNYTNSTAHYRQLLTRMAFASPLFNRISFSFNTLQGELFNPERPDYMNFGTAGTTIAHEITHLFDTYGSLHVPPSMNNGFGIFTVRANVFFQGQVRCFIDQYGNYIDPSINRNVDGGVTVDENIADNASVKRAYHAYVNTLSGKGPEKLLSRLNFTSTQMFWIAYANKNCEKRAPSYLSLMWNQDPHPIGRFRVIGPLSNSPEFANDFNCPLGSKMNPVKKCSICVLCISMTVGMSVKVVGTELCASAQVYASVTVLYSLMFCKNVLRTKKSKN